MTAAARSETRVDARWESPGRRTLRRFLGHRLAMLGVVAIVAIVVLTVVASEELALKRNLMAVNQPPSEIHPLGTDALGRDVLARTLVGGRVSLVVAFLSVALSTVIAVVVGVVAGYLGGRTDGVLMRIVDVALSFPVILLLLVVASIIGPGLGTLVLMIGFVTWAGGARIVRGQVLTLRSATFIEAARVIGVSDRRMIGSHVLPNIVAPVVVLATFSVAAVVIFEAGLSYLGLGVQPPTPSWGNMVNAAQSITVLERYPWQWVPPALFIVAMVMAVNFVGDGLRDAFDMRSTSDR